MKNTISIRALRSKLRKGPFKFYFEKKDGTIREAYGTLNLEIIPIKHLPKTDRTPAPSVVTFYDLENQGWRSLSKASPIFS